MPKYEVAILLLDIARVIKFMAEIQLFYHFHYICHLPHTPPHAPCLSKEVITWSLGQGQAK